MSASVGSFLHLLYRPDNGRLVARWLRSVSDAELRHGYEALAALALTHGCCHWLVDARRRTNRRLNGPEWVIPVFLPGVQAQLPGALWVSFLVLPPHLADAGPAQPGAAGQVHVARFLDEGAANAWLDAQRGKQA